MATHPRNVDFFLGIKCWSPVHTNKNKYKVIIKWENFVKKIYLITMNTFNAIVKRMHRWQLPKFFLLAVSKLGTFPNMCTDQFFGWAKGFA